MLFKDVTGQFVCFGLLLHFGISPHYLQNNNLGCSNSGEQHFHACVFGGKNLNNDRQKNSYVAPAGGFVNVN